MLQAISEVLKICQKCPFSLKGQKSRTVIKTKKSSYLSQWSPCLSLLIFRIVHANSFYLNIYARINCPSKMKGSPSQADPAADAPGCSWGRPAYGCAEHPAFVQGCSDSFPFVSLVILPELASPACGENMCFPVSGYSITSA